MIFRALPPAHIKEFPHASAPCLCSMGDTPPFDICTPTIRHEAEE